MVLNQVLALSSSVLLVLLFPRFSLVWLAPVALTPLLIACARETRWRRRFALGYTCGLAYWFGICNWIQWTLAHHAGVSPAVAWFLFALFCLAKAVQMGVFAALAGTVTRSVFALPAIAALWVVLEWTHSWTGFEWLNLGNAGSGMSLPLRLAPLTGVWGLSFAFALMSAAIAALLPGKWPRGPRTQVLWLLLLPALVFLPDVPKLERGNASAILVQPNIDDETEWTPELVNQTEQQLMILSMSPALNADRTGDRRVDTIVWPEMPAPFEDTDLNFVGRVASVARMSHADVLTGVIARAPDGAPLNSALLMGPDGIAISRYDKVNLVPFGEFVPWPFGLLTKKVSTEAGDFEAGRRVVVSSNGRHMIGTFICYESVFPSYIRKFAASGAEVLFNISNDSWFGKSQARYQHLLIVRMRAAENARWILRATDNGITAAIDPAGRVIRTTQEYAELAARFPYRYRKDQTFYTRYGDWFVALCGLIVVMSGVSQVRRRP
ncbi:MAG TPA: apolipoprotein N-acyltransferase [Bryobacteraceae bacterium]|nr:apolipoprotein N-acyltransferase [Bryobacteraceae bacterium]